MFKSPEVLSILKMDNTMVEGHMDSMTNIGLRVLMDGGSRVTVPWHNIAQIEQVEDDDDGEAEDDDDYSISDVFGLFINGSKVWPI